MILVLLGTQDNSFERLLKQIENCIDEKVIKEEVIVQAGNTKYNSERMQIIDLISREELNSLVQKARFIITHGGVGSIIGALNENKKVIAVPRKHKYKEHVNDHQTQIVENFDKEGYIIGINDVEDLKVAIGKIKDFKPKKYTSNTENFIKIIENYINNN